MIPGSDEYLSYLMGAGAVSDEELEGMGVRIVQRGRTSRGVVIPRGALGAYRELVRRKLTAGFWNEVVGREEILFSFKMKDGTIRELGLRAGDRGSEGEISRLCSEFNGDAMEKTADVARYLAGNGFYREAMRECYGVGDFIGCVILESLEDASVLEGVVIEGRKDRAGAAGHPYPVWRQCLVRVPAIEAEGLARRLSRAIREGWYCHYYDEQSVYVIFKGRFFKLPKKMDESWDEMVAYGESVKIGPGYTRHIPMTREKLLG